jgi:hypothetical protein
VACRPIARQQPWNKQLYDGCTNKHVSTAIMEETFSTLSMLSCYNQDQLAVAIRELLGFSHCVLLLLEDGSWCQGHFGNPEEVEYLPWKPLPSNGSEDVTVDTSVCVIVSCKVLSRAVSKCAINKVINPTSICSHIPHMWQYNEMTRTCTYIEEINSYRILVR